MKIPHHLVAIVTSPLIDLPLPFWFRAIDAVWGKGMSVSTPEVDKITDEQVADEAGCVESWLDDELFDSLVDIINENFVLEVESGNRSRS